MGGAASRQRHRGIFVGLATLDVVSRVAEAPGPNQKVTALFQEVAAGGPAANAAITFAALGGDAVLVTALGNGPVARLVTADLECEGVSVVDVLGDVDADAPVSTVTVVDATGDRSVVGADRAGASVVRPTAPEVTAVLGGADVVLVDGHHPELCRAFAVRARADGIPVVLDAGRWRPVMADLVDLATDVVASGDFGLPGSEGPDATLVALAARPDRVVVGTRGPSPVRWFREGEVTEFAVPVVPVRDTSGAGDVFHGAYARALAGGADVPGRIQVGTWAAGLRCGEPGPRGWRASLRSAGTPP